MKPALAILILLLVVTTSAAQASSSHVAIVTTYSENQKYYLVSVPYDTEFPTLRGKTVVYEVGNPKPIYAFDGGFDSVEEDSNNLILSNDGEIIFYAIPWLANEAREGLKSITIYQHGVIVKSLTETEVTACDRNKERCSLIYNNYENVVDQEKSNLGTPGYKKVFKDGTDEKEKFLSDFPIFNVDNVVYLTDSRKNVHVFDLRDGSFSRSIPFDQIFSAIKEKGRFNRTELKHYEAHVYLDFPKLKDGRHSHKVLAAYLGMKPANLIGSRDEKYKLYTFKITVGISRDGSADVEDIDADPSLPKDRIVQFFKTNKFDISQVPSAFEKWYLTEEFFSFRDANPRIAREAKLREIADAKVEREKRMTQDTINGVYIPKDLGECFLELDKLLTEIDRAEMKKLTSRDDMIQYHLDLGMWMRNNWGLWAGSRLHKYFRDKGIPHPEDMSSLVLLYYYDWLSDKKASWKQWEMNPQRPFAESPDERFTREINKPRKP